MGKLWVIARSCAPCLSQDRVIFASSLMSSEQERVAPGCRRKDSPHRRHIPHSWAPWDRLGSTWVPTGRCGGRSRSWKCNLESSNPRGKGWRWGAWALCLLRASPAAAKQQDQRSLAQQWRISASGPTSGPRADPRARGVPTSCPGGAGARLADVVCGSRSTPTAAGHLPDGCGWESSAGLCCRSRWEGRMGSSAAAANPAPAVECHLLICLNDKHNYLETI